MEPPRFTSAEVVARGQEIYECKLRTLLEAGNKGRVVVIDIETGDYELQDENQPGEASHKLFIRHPGAALYGKRIGYETVTKIGGRLKEENR